MIAKLTRYGANVEYSDGSVYHFARRERPHLIFNDDTGDPTHLVTGVMTGAGDAAFTHISPIRTKSPPKPVPPPPAPISVPIGSTTVGGKVVTWVVVAAVVAVVLSMLIARQRKRNRDAGGLQSLHEDLNGNGPGSNIGDWPGGKDYDPRASW